MRREDDVVISHIVMLRLRDDHDAVELGRIMTELAALQIAGFDGFAHGPNFDLEQKTPDHPYGFICTFADVEGLKRYACDPMHRALGQRLCDLCVGGGAGIMVMDLELGGA